MTNFKGAIVKKSLEDWEDLAIDAIEATGHSPQLLAVAGLGCGMLVAGLAPITVLGLIPFAWGIKSAVEVNNRRSRMEAAIEAGAYAAVLPMEDLKEYSQQFGMEQAIAQIDWAKRAGVPLSEASQTLLTRYQQKYKALPVPIDKATSPTVDVESVEVNEASIMTAENSSSEGDRPASPTTAKEIQERLKAECPELLKLVKSPPIRLVGLQRTGKSTFARKLALLRGVLLPEHKIAWSTPHFEEDNPVPKQLNPFGCSEKGKNYRAIEKIWSGTQDAIDKGRRLNLTIVWDEFGGYGDGFSDPELLGSSLRSLLRESTKHGYYPILVAHGDQAGFYPGVKNILGTLKESTVKVETIGKPIDDFGTMAPTGELKVFWLDGSTVSFIVPSWLTVDLLLGLLSIQDTLPAQVDEPTAAVEPSLDAPTPLPVDTYKTTEKESISADQAIKRIGAKMSEKFKEVGSDWIPVSAVARDLFNNTEDRNSAKDLVDRAIAVGRLESEDRENPNKTKTTFVRVNKLFSINKNPTSEIQP